MVKCCVPDCSSSSYNAKQRGVRFHEFPSNIEMREKWINSLMKFINKPEWSIKDRTRICNLHFKKDDYRPCQKKSVLLPQAYPTVFPSDLHWHSAAFSDQNSRDVCSNVKLIDPVDAGCPIVEYVECTPEHDYRFRLACPSQNRVRLSDVVRFDNEDGETEPKHDTNISTAAAQTLTSELLNNKVSKRAIKENPSDKPNIIGRPPRSTQELRVLLKRKDKKICRLNKKICRLTTKVQALNDQIDKKSGKVKQRIFELVEQIQQDAATGNNVPAQFLLDQILAYGRKLPKYGVTTLMSCQTWRSKFRKGYTYVQKSGLMRLPERTTLLKHMMQRKPKTIGDALLEGLLSNPENEICNDIEASPFENPDDINTLSTKGSIIAPDLMAVSSHQDLHTGLLTYEIRYPPMGEVFPPEGM